MSQQKLLVIAGIILAVALSLNSVFYTVDEREKAIVIQLGQVKRSDDKPGLHAKIPLIQDVRYFDSRILTLDAEPARFLTKEKKSVVVDSFVKWRIIDTLKYFLTMSGDESRARTRMQQLVNDGLRTEFGKRSLRDVVSGDRREIMKILGVNTDKATREFGIEVIDVRLKRIDLPQEVSTSVYRRMEAERQRIAKELRAQGGEASEKIQARYRRKPSVNVILLWPRPIARRSVFEVKATPRRRRLMPGPIIVILSSMPCIAV